MNGMIIQYCVPRIPEFERLLIHLDLEITRLNPGGNTTVIIGGFGNRESRSSGRV